ncbi:MAG TPA: Spy/CpxP family protein refolding chaperone [Terriglobales bacterium]|nr:Spy/CpxP family protein refolding chaperone [Terriglobales bacterium]
MRMKMKFWSAAVALLALALGASALPAYAQQAAQSSNPAPAWTGHRHHGHMAYLARELNLTDAQKQQIKTIVQSQKTTLRPLMQQLAQNRLAMLNATSNGAFNQATVQSLANQRAQIMAQLMVQKASLHSQIYNQVLTPDQRTKADQMRQNQIARINARLEKLSQPSQPEPSAQ